MPLHFDDGFHDRPEISSLPDCSVSSLVLASSWSASNSTSGSVPARVFARFSGGSALVTRTLRAGGLIERVKGGDWQITEGHGFRIENALDVAAREQAEAERAAQVAEAAKERKRQQRDREKVARQAKFVTAANDVTCDIAALSRVTGCDPQIDRSNQDKDLNLDPSLVTGHNDAEAYARDPDLLRFVAGEFGKKAGRIIGDPEAVTVIRTLTKRADEAGTVIKDPKGYFGSSIKRAPEVDKLLDGDPPTRREILAEPLEPPPGSHPYEHSQSTGACGHLDGDRECGLGKTNIRHTASNARAMA